jgi:hypothetical protein
MQTTATAPVPPSRSHRCRPPDCPALASFSARWLAAEVVRSSMIAMITIARPLTKALPTSRLCNAWVTGWPSPGPLINAAIVAIDRAAIMHWLMPTMIVRFAIGSSTRRSTWMLVDPIDRLASIVVGETVRIPCAVIRTSGGSA